MVMPMPSPPRVRPTAAFPANASFARKRAGRQVQEARMLERAQWVDACTARLIELRPADDRHTLESVAADMWEEVASFDPQIAAEMEHESWPAPNRDS